MDSPNDINIHLLLQLGPFIPWSTIVEHRLRFMACVDDQTLDEIRVLTMGNV